MRSMATALLVLAGCEEQPSKLDDLTEGGARWAELEAWATIEERALPLSIHKDLLEAAIAIPDRGTTDQRAAAVVAWMEAGGSIPAATTVAAIGSPGFDLFAMRIVRLVEARPNDERLFEAALYAAWKFRTDGTGYLAAMMASALTHKLTALRDVPPPFAAKYAPTDQEVFRLFASEAMFARRATFDLGEQNNPGGAEELALWREFADAPTERTAFLAFVRRAVDAHPNALGRELMRIHVEKMFAAVDAYQTWLGRSSTAGPAP
jgi:hypothetical protein